MDVNDASGDRMAETKSSETGGAASQNKGMRRRTGNQRRSGVHEEHGSADGESLDPVRDSEGLQKLRASDKRYYRIGEVSRLTGVKAHVLRYWETEFRWMAPPKSRSKQRLYRKRDIELVWLLKRLLWGERYTIAGARQRIQELGLDQALGLLDLPMGMGSVGSSSGGTTASADGPDWTALRATLDTMRNDLLGVRAVLQEGL